MRAYTDWMIDTLTDEDWRAMTDNQIDATPEPLPIALAGDRLADWVVAMMGEDEFATAVDALYEREECIEDDYDFIRWGGA